MLFYLILVLIAKFHAAIIAWVIDIGPGAGDEGGLIVAQGVPAEVAKSTTSRTAPFLSARF